MKGLIPERVRRLIAEHITSIEQLEILLLFRGLPGQPQTVGQINDRIKSSLTSVTARLADLQASGFLRRTDDRYQYDPGAERAAVVDELAQVYAERRYTVIELIFAKPTDKLRVFARAFKLRGDDNDG